MLPFWKIISNNKVAFELTDAPWEENGVSVTKKTKILADVCEVLKRVDYVFCSSTNLFRFARNINPHSYYLPNTTFFPESIKFKMPDKRLRFGFIGNINEWLDLELLEKISKCQSFDIVFVGGINGQAGFNRAFLSLVKRSRVIYKQRVPMNNIFEEIAEFDVCIIPYVKTIYNSFVFPNKLFQYLSCGKQVIVTNFAPDLVELREYVHIADSHEEFMGIMEDFSNGKKAIDYKFFLKTRNFANENSTIKRAELRLKFIREAE